MICFRIEDWSKWAKIYTLRIDVKKRYNMKLSRKYEVELEWTRKNILDLREKLDSLAGQRQTKVGFMKAV